MAEPTSYEDWHLTPREERIPNRPGPPVAAAPPPRTRRGPDDAPARRVRRHRLCGLGQADGRALRGGRAGAGHRADPGRAATADRRRTHRHRRACPRPGGGLRRRGTRALQPQRAPAPRHRRASRAPPRAQALTRATRRSAAPTATGSGLPRAECVPPARHAALGRALDLEALSACAEALLGNHDFTAFTPTEPTTLHSWFRRTNRPRLLAYEDGHRATAHPAQRAAPTRRSSSSRSQPTHSCAHEPRARGTMLDVAWACAASTSLPPSWTAPRAISRVDGPRRPSSRSNPSNTH